MVSQLRVFVCFFTSIMSMHPNFILYLYNYHLGSSRILGLAPPHIQHISRHFPRLYWCMFFLGPKKDGFGPTFSDTTWIMASPPIHEPSQLEIVLFHHVPSRFTILLNSVFFCPSPYILICHFKKKQPFGQMITTSLQPHSNFWLIREHIPQYIV